MAGTRRAAIDHRASPRRATPGPRTSVGAPAPRWSIRARRRARPCWRWLGSAALVITNVRISGRPAVSASDVNSIVNQKVNTAISQLQSQPPAAVTVYDAVRAGLVLIEAQHRTARGSEDLGTGIIIDTQGDILTALHVVQGASAIKVTFADGTTSTGIHRVGRPDPRHRRADGRAACRR